MTSTTDEEELILKTDALGRVRMPAAKRELILDRFERSGMTGLAFAAYIGVKYTTFAGWVQKRRRARGDYAAKEGKSVKASITLFEAVVEEPAPTVGIGVEVETSEGFKLKISTREEVPLAVELLRALGGSERC